MKRLSLLSIRYFFILSFFTTAFSTIGQKSSAQLVLGTSFINEEFIFTHEQKFQRWAPWVVNYPSADASFKYNLSLGDKVGMVIGVAYNRYFVKYENSDYVDALSFYRDYRPILSVRNYVLPQIGVSYQTNQRKKWSFFSEATLKVALPFSCYDEKEFANHGLQKEELYKGDEFGEGVMMGPGLNLGLILRPWRYGTHKNLSFTFSVNSRLFFYTQSDFSANYAFGPNVGVTYQLQ